MKRTIVFPLLLAAFLFAAAGSALAHSTSTVHVTIRHELHGCHTWSVNGGPFKASLRIQVSRNTEIEVANNDVMPHKLVELSGSHVAIHNLRAPTTGMGMHGPFAPGQMGRMGASTETTLSHPGVYVFGTKAGEDYMSGMKTIGEDKLLKLTIVVK